MDTVKNSPVLGGVMAFGIFVGGYVLLAIFAHANISILNNLVTAAIPLVTALIVNEKLNSIKDEAEQARLEATQAKHNTNGLLESKLDQVKSDIQNHIDSVVPVTENESETNHG